MRWGEVGCGGGWLVSGGHTYTDVSRSRVLVFLDPQRDRALTLSEVRLRSRVSESGWAGADREYGI